MYENVFLPVTSIVKGVAKTSGLCTILFFKWEDVLSWPDIDPNTGYLATSIDLKPGAVLYSLESVDTGRSFSEEEKEDEAGSFHDIILEAALKGSKVSNHLSLQTMKFHDWGVLIQDRSGITWLMGNEDSGATFRYKKYDSGDRTRSRSTQIQWLWKHSLPAPIYTAEAFVIRIGGVIVVAGRLSLIMRFRVGDPTAPMNDGDSVLTNAGFANKNLLIIASSLALPCDDGSGDIDWTGSIERHYEKTLASDTVTFVGNVVEKEIIEIYAFSV